MNRPMHPHRPRRPRARPQRGILLLEALIAILIFSIGILGLLALQTTSIKMSSAAEYRAIAARQADTLISQMWLSDHTPATLQANFASASNGPLYTNWLTGVQASGLPGISAAAGTLPTVTLTLVNGGGSSPVASTQATITIFWRAPSETTMHNFVTVAQVK